MKFKANPKTLTLSLHCLVIGSALHTVCQQLNANLLTGSGDKEQTGKLRIDSPDGSLQEMMVM